MNKKYWILGRNYDYPPNNWTLEKQTEYKLIALIYKYYLKFIYDEVDIRS